MEKTYVKKFIVVSPMEISNILSNESISPYIYKNIVANPGTKLIDDVLACLNETEILGILSRGTLANYLFHQNLPVPIYSLKYNTSSLWKLIQDAIHDGHKKMCIFEMCYSTNIQKIDENSSYLHVGDCKISYFTVSNINQVKSKILELTAENDLDIVIGDFEPVMVAKELNIPYKSFSADSRSFQEALQEAFYSISISERDKAQKNFTDVITNIISDSVIISDNYGNIVHCNLSAEKMIGQTKIQNIHEIFDFGIDDITNIPPNYLLTINDKAYLLNIIPHPKGDEDLYALMLSSAKRVESLEMSLRKQNESRGLTAKNTDNIICVDSSTKKILSATMKYAKSSASILIRGETGTGKEIFSSVIHKESFRSEGPFVAVNCAAFNDNLLESELFGYDKGSFTGALSSGKKGLFELAHHGTLFLDEIGELSLRSQAKILRAIQEKEIMRIGSDRIIPVDVRIVAATNKNLFQLVKEGQFRSDLYYRIATLEIEIPPLRERKNDIIPLFKHFMVEILESEGKRLYWENDDIFSPLLEYDWPGNIRELHNFVERTILLSDNNSISKKFIYNMIKTQKEKCMDNSSMAETYSTSITSSLDELERDYIRFLLQNFDGSKETVCSFLNISNSTLWRKMNYNQEKK